MTTNHPLTAHSNRASFLRPKPTHTYIMCMSSARDMCVTHLGSIAHCIYAEPIGDLVLDARIMTQFVSQSCTKRAPAVTSLGRNSFCHAAERSSFRKKSAGERVCFCC